MQIELGKHVFDVYAGGSLSQHQCSRNLPIAESTGRKARNLPLASRQVLQRIIAVRIVLGT